MNAAIFMHEDGLGGGCCPFKSFEDAPYKFYLLGTKRATNKSGIRFVPLELEVFHLKCV